MSAIRYTVLSRNSPLARLQVDEALPTIQACFPNASIRRFDTPTIGDNDLTTPLTDPSIPDDFFTREIDELLLRGDADFAVHSSKDLPSTQREGLIVAAVLPAADTRDALSVRPGVDLSNGGVIGTSSPKREEEIRALYPKIECKPIRGSIQQRLDQMDAGDYDAVIIAACALHRLGLQDRIAEMLDYETTAQQGRLAITCREDRKDLIQAFRHIDVRRTSGMVALVGCPADVAYMSRRAETLLHAADIVLHDRLIPDSVLAAISEKGEYVGKQGQSHSTTQAEIHRRILHEAEKGKLVVRLHGGEPAILGHLGETLEFCEAWNLRCEVVPAVSAAQVAAAHAHASLTHRFQGRSITFMTGHVGRNLPPNELPHPRVGNLAIYMGVKDILILREKLQKAGWDEDTSVTVGQKLGYADEVLHRCTLASLHETRFETPAVFLFGPAAFPDVTTTLFTGTDPEKFLKHGPLLHCPMIELQDLPLDSRRERLEKALATWDGVIFPSGYAVRVFVETLLSFGDTRLLAGKRILAVGPMTEAALRTYGIAADASPSDFGGVTALATSVGSNIPGLYGYPCSDAAPTDKRQAAVVDAGIQLDPVILYQNTTPNNPVLPSTRFHRVLFTSSSGVTNYFSTFPDERDAEREWIAVGTSTRQAIESFGLAATLL